MLKMRIGHFSGALLTMYAFISSSLLPWVTVLLERTIDITRDC